MQIVGFNVVCSNSNILLIEAGISMIITIIISLLFIMKINQEASNILMTIIFCLVILFIDTNYNKYFVKDFGLFTTTIYYTNKNNENIKINKNQIINDILNNKIENNNENLQVYKQAFQITYDEYNLLKPHEVEYKNQSEYGNVKIIK